MPQKVNSTADLALQMQSNNPAQNTTTKPLVVKKHKKSKAVTMTMKMTMNMTMAATTTMTGTQHRSSAARAEHQALMQFELQPHPRA